MINVPEINKNNHVIVKLVVSDLISDNTVVHDTKVKDLRDTKSDKSD